MTRSPTDSDGKVVLLNRPCVHGDELKRFVVPREPGSVDHGLSYVGGAALGDVFLEACDVGRHVAGTRRASTKGAVLCRPDRERLGSRVERVLRTTAPTG